MKYKSFYSPARIYCALGYSLQGLKSTFETEASFRLDVLVVAIAVPTALILNVDAASKAILIGSAFLILVTELINTAIEAAVDGYSKEVNKFSKLAKDASSACVFVAIINATIIWAIILLS